MTKAFTNSFNALFRLLPRLGKIVFLSGFKALGILLKLKKNNNNLAPVFNYCGYIER